MGKKFQHEIVIIGMESAKSNDNEFSEMESCIIILNLTANHLTTAVQIMNDSIAKLDEHIILYSEGIDPDGEIRDSKNMFLIAYEYAILNLFKLLEIHPLLVRHLKESGYESLELALQEVWKPIQKIEKRIRDWRNKYIAHAKNNAKKLEIYTDFDENYSELPREVFVASVNAILYCGAISSNMELEYSYAIEKFQRHVQYERNAFKIAEWKDTHKDFKIIFKNLKDALEKNGYDGDIIHIEQMLFSRNFRNLVDHFSKELKEKLASKYPKNSL